MTPFVVKPISRLQAKVPLPADKSIAHRAIILSAISAGVTKIEDFPFNKDCLATLNALRKLGVNITQGRKAMFLAAITVNGKGPFGLTKPKGPIFVGDSGTTLRILLGVLAAQPFETKLVAGKSLSHRPMRRVTEPLRLMGAQISSKIEDRKPKAEEYPPITIRGGNLKAISYRMPIASAQVKSAILLAGLFAKGETKVVEPLETRDHTERMLKLFKADVRQEDKAMVIKGGRELVSPGRLYIPQDISSAAFFMVLAAIIPDSKIVMKKVSLNPSRAGVIKVLKRMGANIKVKGHPSASLGTRGPRAKGCEPMGDIIARSSKLKGVVVKEEEIPSLIDELPVLMVAACFAKGKSAFKGIGELRVKETDRISSMTENLKKMGAVIKISKIGKLEKVIIEGAGFLKGARVKTFGDHRTAMSMVIAGLAARGETYIDDISCISKSFPGFISIINSFMR